jgi:hypothetical protein
MIIANLQKVQNVQVVQPLRSVQDVAPPDGASGLLLLRSQTPIAQIVSV